MYIKWEITVFFHCIKLFIFLEKKNVLILIKRWLNATAKKTGIFSGTNYNRTIIKQREHRNTDAIDFFPCSVQGFSSINTEN